MRARIFILALWFGLLASPARCADIAATDTGAFNELVTAAQNALKTKTAKTAKAAKA